MTPLKFTSLFLFSGIGPGARGFLQAFVTLLGHAAQFVSLGGIDIDVNACVDFERLTGSPAWPIDVRAITSAMLVDRYGPDAPDLVFMTPPCQGASRLISNSKSKERKYVDLNELALVWIDLMLATWGHAPPKLILLENVPGLPTRAGAMLRKLKAKLRAHGYVFHASTHDCGELGGLAQHRVRYLLVARHAPSCPSLLYQPPKKRVRGVGEVLGDLPMPATTAAAAWGNLHVMPRLSWRNWLRLALIPAGGDWRDLAGVLDGRARREVFRRHPVQQWEEPTPAVTGPGGMSLEAVADPRVAIPIGSEWYRDAYGVRSWNDASGAITAGADNPSRGRFVVADPRVACEGNPNLHPTKHAVLGWGDASSTVIGQPQPSSGMPGVADPRVLADLPVTAAFDAGYGVLGWQDPARTVAATTSPGCGAYAVADPRAGFVADVRVLTLDEAMELDLDPRKPPPFIPLIVAADGTWHRPMTLLELATLQGIPSHLDGAPLSLTGTRTEIATHIGNAVPVGAALAVAERMLIALVEGTLGTMSLDQGEVWVEPANTEALS